MLTSGMFHSSTMGGCRAENQALMLGCGPKTTFSVPDNTTVARTLKNSEPVQCHYRPERSLSFKSKYLYNSFMKELSTESLNTFYLLQV